MGCFTGSPKLCLFQNYKMGASASESESDIERVSSLKSEPESFDINPFDKDFHLKMYTSKSKNPVKIIFPLKKGKTLPYTTITKTKKGRGTFWKLV